MSMPKKKMTSSRSGNRRSHLATRALNLIPCSHCQTPIRPHMICPNCHYYDGQKVSRPTEKRES